MYLSLQSSTNHNDLSGPEYRVETLAVQTDRDGEVRGGAGEAHEAGDALEGGLWRLRSDRAGSDWVQEILQVSPAEEI